MIRDLQPKEYSTTIAGKIYNILPATLGMQAKILHYFEKLEGKQIAWVDLWKMFGTGDPIINSHLAYCMIDFKDENITHDKFIQLLAKKKSSNDCMEQVYATWQDSMPKNAVKKKRVKKIITSLIIISAMICWGLGITYLIKIF